MPQKLSLVEASVEAFYRDHNNMNGAGITESAAQDICDAMTEIERGETAEAAAHAQIAIAKCLLDISNVLTTISGRMAGDNDA